jgi:hypothetical protein
LLLGLLLAGPDEVGPRRLKTGRYMRRDSTRDSKQVCSVGGTMLVVMTAGGDGEEDGEEMPTVVAVEAEADADADAVVDADADADGEDGPDVFAGDASLGPHRMGTRRGPGRERFHILMRISVGSWLKRCC